jgi:hypothetical protein
MAMVECENHHFYDNRKHLHCPYCPVPGLKDLKIPDAEAAFPEVAAPRDPADAALAQHARSGRRRWPLSRVWMEVIVWLLVLAGAVFAWLLWFSFSWIWFLLFFSINVNAALAWFLCVG